MNKKLGFTGTRNGLTCYQIITIKKILNEYMCSEVHHGDCIGADRDFHRCCVRNDLIHTIVVHPPIINKYRAFCTGDKVQYRKAEDYLVRNHNIVNESHLLIACPEEYFERMRSGTWATIRYALKKNKSIIVIFPDGKIRRGKD